jgi:hypothetical protein
VEGQKGASLRTRVPEAIFWEAISPFPFPGIVSSIQRPVFNFMTSVPFEVVLLDEAEGGLRLGAILINMQRS